MEPVIVVGAGLAGSEAAWQLAQRGIAVRLVEMRPLTPSPAHRTDGFGELVCSNSLGSDALDSPAGLLKEELRRLGSLIMAAADGASVPAGKALAVDRDLFSERITEALSTHRLITVERREVTEIPQGPCIVASGPLTSPALAERIGEVTGGNYLYFFDAVAPVLELDSVDLSIAYRKDRYSQREGGDYLNCPMDKEQYLAFWEALCSAERAPLHSFEEKMKYFEGCMPVEVLASRGVDTLRFGPLRPVGLEDPQGRRPYAVVQLRQDNREGTLYNLVGFQTNLRWGEQLRVFRMIPGLERANFVRMGVMHRNLYVDAPRVLDRHLRPRGREDLFLAGQITGVEGYVESTAMGLVAAWGAAALIRGLDLPRWPREGAIGALLHRLQDDTAPHFQPSNVNLGLFPPLERKIRDRDQRCAAIAQRARAAMDGFLMENAELL